MPSHFDTFDTQPIGTAETKGPVTSDFDTFDTFDTALERLAKQHDAYYTAADLQAKYFPPPRWAVEGLIPEGLTVFGGPSKVGKSWFALSVALDKARGAPVLGAIPTEPAPVLYLALEDTNQRMKSRLAKMGGDKPLPQALTIVTLPGLPDAAQLIDEHLEAHSDTGLVIVDVLAKIRPAQEHRDQYKADYQMIGALKEVADRHHVPIVTVTHTRKLPDADTFNEIAGSVGVMGASDTALVLKRPRNENTGTLSLTGRDVQEAEYAVRFMPESGRWILDGSSLAEAVDAVQRRREAKQLGDLSTSILEAVSRHPDGITPAALAAELDLDNQKVGDQLKRLADGEHVRRLSRGVYAPNSTIETVETVESAGQTLRPISTLGNEGAESVETRAPQATYKDEAAYTDCTKCLTPTLKERLQDGRCPKCAAKLVRT